MEPVRIETDIREAVEQMLPATRFSQSWLQHLKQARVSVQYREDDCHFEFDDLPNKDKVVQVSLSISYPVSRSIELTQSVSPYPCWCAPYCGDPAAYMNKVIERLHRLHPLVQFYWEVHTLQDRCSITLCARVVE